MEEKNKGGAPEGNTNAEKWDLINTEIQTYWKLVPQIKSKLTSEEISQLDEFGRMRFINSNKAQLQDLLGDDFGWYSSRNIETATWKIKEAKKSREQLDRLEKRMQERFNASIYDGTEDILNSLKAEREELIEQKEQLNSDENIALETAKMEEDICGCYLRAKYNAELLKESHNNYVIYGRAFNSLGESVSVIQRWFEGNRETYLQLSNEYKEKYNQYFNLMGCK